MKKLIGLLMTVVVLLCCGFSLALAEDPVKQLEVNKNGKVRMSTNDWRTLTKAEKVAYANPGKEVPAKLFPIGAKHVDFFHYTLIRRYDQVITYKDGKLTTIVKSGKVVGEKEVTIYKVLILVVMLFMLMVNIFFVKVRKMLNAAIAKAKKTSNTITITKAESKFNLVNRFTFFFTIVAIAVSFAALLTVISIHAIAAAFAVSIVAIAVIFSNLNFPIDRGKKNYKWEFLIFWIASGFALFV